MNKNELKRPEKPNQFQPGQVANPNGRPKGSPNKVTTLMKETMYEIFMNNKDKIQQDLNDVEAKDRLNFLAKLFPYFMPTLTASKIEKTVNHTGFEHLSTEKLTELIFTIKQPSNIEDATIEDNEQ
jgi:hypothetical protein